jgi:LPXTG-motif cell wall-anchored protein
MTPTPKTGDNATIAIWSAAATLTAVALVLVVRKRQLTVDS